MLKHGPITASGRMGHKWPSYVELVDLHGSLQELRQKPKLAAKRFGYLLLTLAGQLPDFAKAGAGSLFLFRRLS